MSGVEEGAHAPIESFGPAASRLAERINLVVRDKRPRDLVPELTDAVEAFLAEGGIADGAGGNALAL